MNPDGPAAVTVTLTGGPCDGQIINVWPRGDGLMPYTFDALPPADHWAGPTPTNADYSTYLRDGDARTARTYVYLGEVVSDAR